MSKKPIYVTWNSTINNFQLDVRVGNDSGAPYVAVRFAKSLLNKDELIEKSSAQSKAWDEYKENLTVYLVSRASKFEPKGVEVREELFNFLQGEDTKSGYYIGKADHFRTRGGYLFGIELGVAPSLEFPVRVDDIANDALEYTEIFWNPELKAPSLAEYELISFSSISGLYNRESETKTLQLTQVDKETYELIERDIKFRNKLEIRTDNAPDLKAGNGRATITLNFSGINVLDVDGVPAEFSAKNATLTCRRFGAETLDVLTNVTSVSSRTITYTVDDLSTIGSLLLDFTTASPHQYNSIDEFTIAIKIDRSATSSTDGDVSSPPPAVVPHSQPKEEIYLDWKDIEYSNNSYTLEYETPEPAPYIIVRANLTLTNRSELIERAEGNGYTLSAYRDVLTIYLDGVEDNTVDNVFDFSSEPDSKTVTLLLEGEKFHKSGAYIFDFNTKDFDTFVTPTWTKGSINESVTMIMAELPWDQSRGVPRLEDFVLRDASELDTLYPRAGSEGTHKFHLREVEENRYSIEVSNVKFKDGLLFDTNNIPAFAYKDGNFDVTVNVTLRGLTVKGPGFKPVINNEYNMTGGFVVDNNPKTAFAPTATLEEGTFTVTEDKSKFKSNMLFYVNGVSSDRQYTSIDYIKVEAVLVDKAAPPSEEPPPVPPSEEPPPAPPSSNENGNDSSPPSTGGGSSQPKKEVKIRWSNAEFNTYYRTIDARVHPSSNYIVVQASLSLKNYEELLNSARDRDLTIGNFKDNLTIGLYDKDHGKFADLFSFANGKTEQTVTFIAEASRFRKNPSTVTFSFSPLEYDTFFNPSWGTSGDINENIKIKIADFAWPHSEVPTLDGVELIDIGVVLDQYISNPYGHKYYLSELSPLHYAIELQDLKFKDSVIISAEQVADYTSLSNDHIITLKASVRNVKVRDEYYKEISDGRRYGLIGEFKPGIGVDPLFHYTAELDSADQTLELEKSNVWNREIFKLSSSFGSPQYNDVGYLKVEVIVKKKEAPPPPPKEPEPPTDSNTGDVQPPPPPPIPPDTGDGSEGSDGESGESETPPDTEVPDESEEPFVPPKIAITDPGEIVLYQDLHALLTALDYHTGKNIPNLKQPILDDPEHVNAREAFKSELLQLAGSEWTNHNNYFFKSLESFNYQLLYTRFGIEQFKDPHSLVNHSLYSTTVEDIKAYALSLLYRFYKFYAGQVLDKDWGPSPFNTIEAIFLNFIEMVKGRDLNEEIMKKVMEKVEKTIKPQSKVNEICSKIEASLLKEMTGGQLRTEVYEYTRIADKVYHRRMPQIQSYFKVTKGFLIEVHPTYDEGKFNYFRMRAVHYNLPT